MKLSNIEELLDLCKNHDKIFIYGAGQNGKRLYAFLKKYGVKIGGFVVSNMKDNPDFLYNLSVTEIESFKTNAEDLIVVSITKNSSAYNSVFSCLTRNKQQNVFFLSFEDMTKIRDIVRNNRVQDALERDIYHLGIGIPVETYHSILVMTAPSCVEYHWRFKTEMFEQQDISNILDVFSKKTILEEFEAIYGRYHILNQLKADGTISKISYTVYMAQSHVDKNASWDSLPSWIIPIQVGAALTSKKICAIQDSSGQNISDRNPIYSECTALYWMWKNAPKTDYIGLCHYRRHFDMSDIDFLKLVSADIDVLVTTPTFVNEGVHSFFDSFVPQSDMDYLLRSIEKVCPEYLPDAKAFLNAKFFPPCNLSIMKYELFQKYMEYVFSITFEIERCYDELHFYRNDRYIGYLVEWLLGIFLMHHKNELKIAYTDMLFYL